MATTKGPGKMIRGRGGRDRHQWMAGVDRGQAIRRWWRNRRIGLWRAWTRPQRGREAAAPTAQRRLGPAGECRQAPRGRSERAYQLEGALARRDRGCPGGAATHHPGGALARRDRGCPRRVAAHHPGGHWLGETEAAQGELLHATQEGHWLGETEATQGGLLHSAPKPGEKAGQP